MTETGEPTAAPGPPLVPRAFQKVSIVVGLRTPAMVVFAVFAAILTCACAAPPQPTDPPASPVVGVVVSLDQVSLTQVNSFDLRTPDGKTVTLKVGTLDNATQFSLSHLATHMATGVPIRAFYRIENGAAVVYHLEDAIPAGPSPNAT